ncbi:acyl-CoA thioesterase [Nostocoides vanveenii]|uniref:Acyl-CoA thioesterase-like N-terminal HotDog domain-containing protein n=1 Tax=Nostocoides vanveenii TaxID=330835 RepID=A0ABP4W9K9_9MICO
MTQFDRGIAVTAAGGGVYDTEISDDWRIARGVNGGLLLALVANAVSAELGEHGHPDPVAMSAAYLGVPHTGPAQIAVDVMRTGGTYSVVRADLIQQEDGEQPSVRVAVQAVFGDLDALPPEVSTSATPPSFTPFERCLSSSMAPGGLGKAPFLQRVDLRIDPLTVSWALGAPAGLGAIQGWFSMVEPRGAGPADVAARRRCPAARHL